MDLTERKKQILKRVVEDYIAAAEPVGSKALAEEMGGTMELHFPQLLLAEIRRKILFLL